MRLFLLSACTLFLALTIRPGPGSALVSPSVRIEPELEEPWYSPEPEHFRPHYELDVNNRQKQSWEQYWSWVRTFYEGNLMTHGWIGRSKGLIAEIRLSADQNKLRSLLNAAGKEIALEWSKDDRVRKVGTTDLLTWGKTLEKAKAQDDGSGQVLRRVIEQIRQEYRRKQIIGRGDVATRQEDKGHSSATTSN